MRLYDGCPDSKLRSYLDEQKHLRQIIWKTGYRVNYFLEGEFYQAYDIETYLPVGPECKTLFDVVIALLGEEVAMSLLKQGGNNQ